MTETQHSTQVIQLEQGQPFWLDQEDGLWQLREGSVNIYAVTPQASPWYRQIYLFTAERGSPIFALPRALCGYKVRLLAVSPQGAVLKVMSRVAFVENAARIGEYLFEAIWFMIEEWLSHLLTGPEYVALPRKFSLLQEGQLAGLEKGVNIRAERDFIWAQVVSGEVRDGRLPNWSLDKKIYIPLHSQTWLTVIGEGETTLCGLSTEKVFPVEQGQQPEVFWQALDESHLLFAESMAQLFARERQQERRRLALRKQQREKLLHSASAQLLQSDLIESVPSVSIVEQREYPLVGAVQAIAKHLGVPVEQVGLPKGWEGSKEDRTLLGQIACRARMHIRLIRWEPNWHRQDHGPILAYWGEGAIPVALLPVSPVKYKIYFPAEGLERPLTDLDVEALHGEGYVFYSSLPETASGIYPWIRFSLAKAWSNDYWTIFLASLAAGIIPLLSPFVTNTIFTDLIPINDRQGHIMVIQVMMVAAFASVGVSLARSIACLRVKGHSRAAGEAALWLRLLSLPASFFRRYEAGDLAQRMNGISQISLFLSESSLAVLFNGLFSLFSLGMMIYYSWQLSLAAVLLLALYLAVVIFLFWKMVGYKRKMTTAAGKVAGQGLQLLNGLNKFRMQGAESQAFYLWAKEFGEQWKWNRANRWKGNWLEMVNAIQPLLMSMLLFWITMHWMEIADGENKVFISQAEFLSFHSALTGFSSAILAMVPMVATLLDIVPSLERLRPILEAKPEVHDDRIEVGELTGQIEIHKLCFRYSPDKAPVLQNVSMKIRPGQFIAVVGASGSGKSTLLRLLLGFEKPDNGAIYFDGQDISELNTVSVRSQMGVVLQHGQLMSGDIFTNIVGALPLSLEDAWQAAEMVGLAEDIRAMPMGMHTIISEGANNISGGQRQRILIARSIVNRPRIIVFDEATSALDNRTQAIVTETLDKMKATRIIVAHRLSTISGADKIYVLDKGEIVESGNYEELVEKGGLFAALAKRQLA